MATGRRTILAASAALVLLLMATGASATTQYRYYFLKDGPGGPADDGKLDLYNFLHPNRPNATAPQIRLVTPASGIEPARFLTAANETHPDRLKGYLYIVVVPGPAAVSAGNLTATLYEVPASPLPDLPSQTLPVAPPGGLPVTLPTGVGVANPQLPPPLQAEPKALLTANMRLDLNASRINPTALVPPCQPDPTNPASVEGCAAYAAFYEAAQLQSIVGGYLIDFGLVDLTVNATSQLALGFTLTQGDSSTPLPQGAFGSIEYNGILQPSYVLLPWYTKDVAKTPTGTVVKPVTATPRGTNAVNGGGTGGASASSTDGGKRTPDAGLLLLPVLGALAALARRRFV